jgi:ligand-binding sensor protein
MKGESQMIALQDASITEQSNFKAQPTSGLLSERAAIVICGLGVAVFAIPILVVIQALSGLFWGGVTVYNLLNGSGFE